MKRMSLRCVLLSVLTATSASASAGVNLRWDACFADSGASNRTFTCNSGTNVIVGSFVLGADLLLVSGVEIVIDIATAGATLPAWWQFKSVGTCRQASLALNPTISLAAVNCLDWASGAAAGGLAAYNFGHAGPKTARLIGGFAVPASSLADLFAGQEYFAFNALISNSRTVGTGACAGCSTGADIVCNSIKVATPPVAGQPSRDVTLFGPTNGTDSHIALWQGGSSVPTHTTKWSALKTIYH